MFIIIFLHDLAIIILGYPPFSDTSGPPKSSLLCKPVPYLFTIKAGLASLNSAGSTWQSESKFGHRSPWSFARECPQRNCSIRQFPCELEQPRSWGTSVRGTEQVHNLHWTSTLTTLQGWTGRICTIRQFPSTSEQTSVAPERLR